LGSGGTSKVHIEDEDHLNYHAYHRHMQSSPQSSCIDISIFLDEYPADTSWTIVDNSTGTIMNTSPAYDDDMALTEQTTENICLAVPGTYSFIISDAYNDGLCCVWGEGSYTVTSSSSGQVLASGGVWKGPNETTTFTLDDADPNPPPTTNNNNNVPTLQPTIYYNTPSIINNNTTIQSDDATTTTTTENETITTQVNIYLTGVPNNNQNMTNQEQTVFETLFYTILHSRLETVDVNITKVVVDAQINNPEFDVDSPFESLQQTTNNNGGGSGSGGGGDLPVLQLVTNITLTYSDPPPEGWRDWSIYLTSWIESFGPTMVDIFTDPKHDLYPNEEFFNTISYVSATNVVPSNTDPTASPTLAPTYLGAPEYKKPLVAGMASSGVIVVVVFFLGAMWYKQRRLRMTRTHNNDKSILPEEERNDDKKKMEEKELGGSLDGEENPSSSPDVMMESSSLPSTVHRSNRGDMSSTSGGRRRMFDNNYTMEELGSLDEESPSPPDDVMLESSSLQSTVRRSNRGDVSSRSGGSRRMFDNNYTMEELSSLDEENSSSSPDVTLESSSLQSTVRRSNRGDMSSTSVGRRRMFDNNYTMEELGSLDEENPSSSPDVMLASSLPSTVHRSNKGDVSSRSGGSSSRGYDNNYHQDGSESIQTSRTILEEEVPPTPTPRQGALQDDFAQYDKIVAAVSANNPNLTQVVLDNKRQIGSNNDGGEALWQALATNKYVTLLSLRNSNIVDDQIAALALALNENTSISHLSLENNNITSEGVEYLVVCLECNSTIYVIDLEGNSPIDPRILDELKGILQSRAGQSNGVSDGNKKLDLLLERVRVNDPNLTQLDLHGMDIEPKDNDAIMDALAGNLYLRKVDLSSNVIDDDCVSALSLALAENTSITHLVLANNRITSIGAEYLLCVLDTNETIVDVDLTGNSIDAEVIAELNHALEERSSF